MILLSDLQKTIHKELKYFDFYLKKNFKSSIPLLNNINKYIYNNKGKQIRPILIFLSALLTGKITKETHLSALLIELLHTATLIHDDVIDNSYERRGNFSINALWNNKISILVGDYLFSKVLSLLIKNNNMKLLSVFMNVVKKMSEGELMQAEKTRLLDIDEKTYLEIINNKTASFIETCCIIGAISSNNTIKQQDIDNISLFGKNIGMAFQIQDDIFDYNNLKTGKTLYGDIKQKKITLPLIYALNNTNIFKKNYIIHIINTIDSIDSVNKIVNFVIKNKGIEYSKSVFDQYIEKAIKFLYRFPSSNNRQKLENFITYIVNRQN